MFIVRSSEYTGVISENINTLVTGDGVFFEAETEFLYINYINCGLRLVMEL
jgi:hypothetical protein